MTVTTLARSITGGVDTHLDVHVAAALDERGTLLGVESFATKEGGYKKLMGWLSDNRVGSLIHRTLMRHKRSTSLGRCSKTIRGFQNRQNGTTVLSRPDAGARPASARQNSTASSDTCVASGEAESCEYVPPAGPVSSSTKALPWRRDHS